MEQNYISWNPKKKIVAILLYFLSVVVLSCKQPIFISSHEDSICSTFKDTFFQAINEYEKENCGREYLFIDDKKYDILYFSNEIDCSESFLCVYKGKELLLYRKVSETCFFYKRNKQGKELYRYFLSKVPSFKKNKYNLEEINDKIEVK